MAKGNPPRGLHFEESADKKDSSDMYRFTILVDKFTVEFEDHVSVQENEALVFMALQDLLSMMQAARAASISHTMLKSYIDDELRDIDA